jgi:hypothetical protein
MDTETEVWPTPSKHKDEFESMKFDFMACPLRVYRHEIFVEPRDVNEALMGAVVEVFFAIRHCYLRDKKFDTFQADMQQIRIIRPGGSITTSGFKRRNAREGPLDVIRDNDVHGHTHTFVVLSCGFFTHNHRKTPKH